MMAEAGHLDIDGLVVELLLWGAVAWGIVRLVRWRRRRVDR